LWSWNKIDSAALVPNLAGKYAKFFLYHNSIPEDAILMTDIENTDFSKFTHPVGADWDGNGKAHLELLCFSKDSDVSVAVAQSTILIENVIKYTLNKHKDEVLNSNEIEFGPWPFQVKVVNNDTVIWFPDNNELHYAYGHVTPFGTIEIKVNRNDMSVTHIKYSGSFNDIYDFEYNKTGEAPGNLGTDGATVQLGYDITKNPDGKVFRSKVEFEYESDDFEYNFN